MFNLGLVLGIGYEYTQGGKVISPETIIWFNGVPLLFDGDYLTYL